MPECDAFAPTQMPSVLQHTHTSFVFHKTQRRYAERPISHFPWKDFDLQLNGKGYVVGSDWAMTTFDNRTEDQFYDPKRLQTIHEGAEVRFFYPFEPLNFPSDLDLDVVEESRQPGPRPHESIPEKVFHDFQDAFAHIGHKLQNAYRSLFGCP